ncbi:MAG: hypothetical protein AAF570_28045 [Bacteroidota bacterium]
MSKTTISALILLVLACVQPVAFCGLSRGTVAVAVQKMEATAPSTQPTPRTRFALPSAHGLEVHAASGGFRIVFQVPDACPTTLRLVNLEGRTARTLYRDLAEPGRPYRLRASTDGLPGGVYYCELRCPGKVKVAKVLVMEGMD